MFAQIIWNNDGPDKFLHCYASFFSDCFKLFKNSVIDCLYEFCHCRHIAKHSLRYKSIAIAIFKYVAEYSFRYTEI